MTPAEAQALAYVDHDLDGDEGTVPYAYPDHLGYLTIGRGILVDKRKGGKLLPEEIAFINTNRLKLLLAGVQREPWYPAVATDPVRLAAILNISSSSAREATKSSPRRSHALRNATGAAPLRTCVARFGRSRRRPARLGLSPR